MLSSCSRIPVVALCAARLLALPAAALAQTDPAIASAIVGSHYQPNARLWAMGGASAALPQDGQPLSANPAAAISAEKTEAIIGYLDTRLDHPVQTRRSPDPSDLHPADPGVLSPALYHSPEPDGSRSHFAARCGPDSQWAWGISAEAPSDACARFLQFGMVHHTKGGLTFGLNCSRIVAPSPAAVQSVAVGAAYSGDDWTLALDLQGAAGALSQAQQALIGAEYRLRDGLALRVGCANGNPTFGFGYRKGDWSIDLARISVARGQVAPLTTPLIAESDLTVLSVGWTY